MHEIKYYNTVKITTCKYNYISLYIYLYLYLSIHTQNTDKPSPGLVMATAKSHSKASLQRTSTGRDLKWGMASDINKIIRKYRHFIGTQ